MNATATDTKVPALWEKYWQRENEKPQIEDAMCLFLSWVLRKDFKKSTGREMGSVMEVGAGSGRASRYLNQNGARTGILDFSNEALKLARHVNQDVNMPVHYFALDMFEIGPAKVSYTYDVVWSAGVLQYFSSEERKMLLGKMATILEPDGRVYVLSTNAGSLFYRVGKWVLMKLGNFPHWKETPVDSMVSSTPPELHLVSPETSTGFMILFVNVFKVLMGVPALKPVAYIGDRLVQGATLAILNHSMTRTLFLMTDRVLSRAFGGYLLFSQFKKA